MTTSIPIEFIQIEDDGAHLLISTTINGKDSLLLIDTGASRTVFDNERIRSFVNQTSFEQNEKLSTGLGTNSMPTSMVKLNSITLGSLTILEFNAVLLDLNHVIETYGKLGYSAIDGVLGNDILVDYGATIDYKKRTLTLELEKV
jgi:predicted aspartyl protease